MEPRSTTRNILPADSGSGALDRAISVFEAVVDAAPETSLAAVAARTGLPKSTVHRTLRVWTLRGYVVVLGHGLYGPGPRVLAAAGRVSEVQDSARLARGALRGLQRHTDHTVHLALLDGREAVYVEKLEGRRPYRMASAVGMRLPLHCTAIGKAILAHLPEGECDLLIGRGPLQARTSRTLRDRTALHADLAAIRRRGWALDDEENEVGIRCVGACVFDHRNEVAGAVSVSAPAFDFQMAQVRRVASHVIEAAGSVTAALGGSTESQGAHNLGGLPRLEEGN